jgi:hypothetical protein
MSKLYYKILKFDNVEIIAKQLLDIVPDGFLTNADSPPVRMIDLLKVRNLDLLRAELAKINLTPEDIHTVQLVVLQPHNNLDIHTDGLNKKFSLMGLNWPISGIKGTRCIFYESKIAEPPEIRKKTIDGKDYIVYSSDDMIEVTSIEYTEPVLLKVDQYHSVDNPNDTPRVTVSLRFNRNIEDFKDF